MPKRLSQHYLLKKFFIKKYHVDNLYVAVKQGASALWQGSFEAYVRGWFCRAFAEDI